ncbi:MAG: PTS sugar transporter subunit IIA [Candidatus Wallbacteria bacterium]|nr:PTS sugar transporter subunit IIA [Candidatus Wallbacteria bacterium]
MNISKFLPKEHIKIGIESDTKEGMIQELIDFILPKTNLIRNQKKLFRAILERERKASTGIGMGIAIPHGRTFETRDFLMVLGISAEGRDFQALDNLPVHLIFLMSAPPDNDTKYLKVIRELSASLRDDAVRESLIMAENPDTAYFILKNTG